MQHPCFSFCMFRLWYRHFVQAPNCSFCKIMVNHRDFAKLTANPNTHLG